MSPMRVRPIKLASCMILLCFWDLKFPSTFICMIDDWTVLTSSERSSTIPAMTSLSSSEHMDLSLIFQLSWTFFIDTKIVVWSSDENIVGSKSYSLSLSSTMYQYFNLEGGCWSTYIVFTNSSNVSTSCPSQSYVNFSSSCDENCTCLGDPLTYLFNSHGFTLDWVSDVVDRSEWGWQDTLLIFLNLST